MASSCSSPSSLMSRLICPKGIARSSFSNYCILGKQSVRSCAVGLYRRGVRTAAVGLYRRGVRTAAVRKNQDSSSSSSPWLMLSPEFEGGTTSYKFYSLAEKKVQTPSSSPSADVAHNLRLRCSGSSHGWLALWCPDDEDVFFLFNPISRSHIKLPSVVNLPETDDSRRNVIKVILSCSPEEDEENCRAVMIICCSNALAFCCPGRSKDWTLMGDEKSRRYYLDCVYSTSRKLFFGLTMDSVETWDLRDPSSPRLIKIINVKTVERHMSDRYYNNYSSLARYSVGTMHHLVVAEQDLLFVIQYVMDYVGPDGSCYAHLDESRPDNCRHMTIGFDIYKYDPNKRGFDYVDSSSLGGLALFLGMPCHSVAIQASRFPELQPNSIYFTDPYFIGWEDELGGPFTCHDIGIFSYEDKTVSPCYYPRDVQIILPSPIWFFPSRPI